MMLPNEWKKVRLGDLTKVSSGSTPLRSNKAFYENGNIPWVKTLDLNNGRIEKTQECITELAAKKCKQYPSGTVLVAMYGGFNQIGRTGLLTFPASINQALAALQFGKDIYPEYVLHYLNANVANWRSFAASSRKDPNITSHDVEDFEICLPTYSDQKKIAKTLSVWDKAIEKTEILIKKKETLFSSELNERITEASRKDAWEHVPLEKVVNTVNPPRKLQKEDYLNDGLYPIIDQSKNLVAGWTNDKKSLVPNKHGLIVFGDHTCVLKMIESEFAQGADGIKILSVSDKYCVKFVYYSLLANPIIPEGYKRHFSSLMLKDFCFPSNERQKHLVAYFEVVEKEINLLKQQLENYKKQKQGLMQKLLTGQWRV